MKKCNKCGVIKPKEIGFYKQKLSRDGYENQCKDCVKERRRKRYSNIIYEIYCITTNKYYIGQTKKCITERISKHFSDAKANRKQPLYVDMRLYPKDAFLYKIIEKDVLAEDMDTLEQKYIKEYMQQGKNMYNVELGGKRKCIIQRETRIKQSKAKGVRNFYAINLKTMKIVDEFLMIKDAKKQLNINNIGKVLNKQYFQFKNHTFIYVDEFVDMKTIQLQYEEYKKRKKQAYKGENNGMFGKASSNRKTIIQKDLYGNFIDKYKSYKQLEEKTGFNRSSVAYSIKKNKPFKGYLWEIDKTEPSLF